MNNFNHDDALPGNDFNDEQSVFTGGGQAPGVPTPPESDGKANLAKYLMIGFVVVIVAFLGWFGYKLMNRGGGAADTLSIPVQDQSTLPMTGAPVPTGNPYDAQAIAQVPNSQVIGPSAPSGPSAADPKQAEQQQQASPNVPAQSVHPDQVPTTMEVAPTAAAPGTAEPPVAAVATVAVTQPSGQAAPSSAARPESQDELQQLRLKVQELEKRVASLAAAGGPARSSAPREARQAARQAATTSRAKPKDGIASARVVAAPGSKTESVAPNGIQLKAVLEGRAWLQLKSGETVSVAPGDAIPGAGTVSAIDVERNEVRLSNGSSLR